MNYEIICGYCGTTFQAKRSSAKFCSDNCRVRNHQEKAKQSIQIATSQSSVQVANQESSLSLQLDEMLLYNKIDGHIKWLDRHKLKIKDVKRIIKKNETIVEDHEKNVKLINIDIEELKQSQLNHKQQEKRWKEEYQTLYKEVNKKVGAESIRAIVRDDANKLRLERLVELARTIQPKLNELHTRIFDKKRKVTDIESRIKKGKDIVRKQQNLIKGWIEKRDERLKELVELQEKRKLLIKRKSEVQVVATPQIIQPKKVKNLRKPSKNEVGAGDLQAMNFEVFNLPGELGAFLGELDKNKTCIALTGDSGAGKTYFSYQLAALFIAALGIEVKYFSLEEGIGPITQKKVSKYGLGNELKLTDQGNLEEVRKAAKEYPMVIVDSFNKLDAKADDFEKLRMDFPNTLFILIFQKTASGTIRGGSAIKYNSSATIDVIRRDGERIAIMEKGRYGTIGWEYSISEDRVIMSTE